MTERATHRESGDSPESTNLPAVDSVILGTVPFDGNPTHRESGDSPESSGESPLTFPGQAQARNSWYSSL